MTVGNSFTGETSCWTLVYIPPSSFDTVNTNTIEITVLSAPAFPPLPQMAEGPTRRRPWRYADRACLLARHVDFSAKHRHDDFADVRARTLETR